MQPVVTDPEFVRAVEETDARIICEFACAYVALTLASKVRPYQAAPDAARRVRADLHRQGLPIPGQVSL